MEYETKVLIGIGFTMVLSSVMNNWTIAIAGIGVGLSIILMEGNMKGIRAMKRRN